MSLSEITNHADLAIGLLLDQFRDQANLEAFLRALMVPVQRLEATAHDLDTEMRLDNAIGAQLDMIGRIVDLPRGDMGDEAYRTRLRAHIRANLSEGTPDDLLEVLRLMVPTNDISLEEYPTGVVMRIADTLAEDPDAIVAELRRTRPAAVPMSLEYTLAEDEDTFAFASGDTEEADSSAGFSGMRWAAVGDDAGTYAYIATSDADVATWTSRNSARDEALNGIASDGNGTLIAVGDQLSPFYPHMGRSTDDGVTWESLGDPAPESHSVHLRAICYSPDLGVWVAVGDDAGTEALILTSDDDGDTWTPRSNPDDAHLRCVCWCPSLGLFIAGGDPASGDSYLITSSDGITWTERSHPKNSAIRGICWSEDLGLAVAVGDSDGADGYVITSPDGINWTERANPVNLSLYGVCWSEVLSLFCAVGNWDGAGCYVVTSPDGISWTRRNSNVGGTSLHAVAAHGASELAAVGGAYGGDAVLITSDDGITWTERANPANYDLHAVAGLQRQTLGGAWAYDKEA